MRKLLISLGLLILILVSIPALVGQYLKYRLLNELSTATWPKGYRVNLTGYHAGWFNSQANLTIGINNSAIPSVSNNPDHEIVMNLNIFHGPITYTRNLQNMPQLFAGLGVVSGDARIMDLPLQVYAKIKFNMDIQMNVGASKYKHQNANSSVSLTIDNLNTQILVSNHFTNVSGNSAINNFSVVDPESKLFIPTISSTFNLEKDASGIWVGEKYNTIPAVNYYQNNQNLLNLSGVVLNAVTTVNNNQFGSKITAQIDKVMPLNYEVFGPGNYVFSLKNVNATTMNQFNQFLTNTDFTSKDLTPEQTNQMTNQLFLYLVKLIQGSQVSIDQFSMMTPRGNISLVASVKFPAMNVDVNQQSNPIIVNNMAMQLGMGSNVSLQAIAPIQFIVDTMNKLSPNNQTWMDYLTMMNTAGLVKSDGTNLSTNVQYSQKSPTINGVPMEQVMSQYRTLLLQYQQKQAAGDSTTSTGNTATPAENSSATSGTGSNPASKSEGSSAKPVVPKSTTPAAGNTPQEKSSMPGTGKPALPLGPGPVVPPAH